MHVHSVENVQLAIDPLVREYLLLPLAKHGQVGVGRNVRERRQSDTLAHLLGCEPRLGVIDETVANRDKEHFGLESKELDNRLALRLVL